MEKVQTVLCLCRWTLQWKSGLGLLVYITPHRPDARTFLGVLFYVKVRTYEVESTECKLVEKKIIDYIYMV